MHIGSFHGAVSPQRADIRHAESGLIQLAHALACLLLHVDTVFAYQAEVGVMVHEVTEGLLAIAGVFHRVEDVVVPEGVDIH